MAINKKELKEFPKPLKLTKLLGPSFVILALGLGSGEVILWPYLVSNYGLGIVWGALLGITFQYFLNMEIERYALAKGESAFVGINKVFKFAPYWFIISTLIGFGLPGIIAAASQLIASVFNIADFRWLAIPFLIIIGLILTLSSSIYKKVEKITKTILLICVPFIITLAIIVSTKTDWIDLGKGLVGIGHNYFGVPAGISLATFLAAFAYSGAGGNLNLTQSIYIKEKGYGMGIHSQKISGLFKSKEKVELDLEGHDFELNESNLKRFKQWWKTVSIEHLIVFWGLGIISMLILMVLSYTTTFGGDNGSGIKFVIQEGLQIGEKVWKPLGSAFLIAAGILLLQTQMTILDSTSRICAENSAIIKLGKDKSRLINLSKIYIWFLWGQITLGITLFSLGFYEPKTLIVMGAVINAIAMLIHTFLVNWANYKILPKQIQPSIIRRSIIIAIFIFLLGFSIITLKSNL